MMNLRILIFIVSVYCAVGIPVTNKTKCPVKNPAVINFQKYVQIDTSRAENLYDAVEFLRLMASDVGLAFAVYEPAGKPICVLTWPGSDSTLPTIMLNSHMDVVYVEPYEWLYPPFAAHIDEDCNLYGRGSQDTKDVGIQYIEAIRKLKKQNVQPKRTVHITFMPDEENEGVQGMKAFLESDDFKDLNVGFALDEGLTSRNDDLFATYQDKGAWSINITVVGDGGHGARMIKDVAVEKLNKLLDVIFEYRKSLEEDLASVDSLYFGLYTTMNVNAVNGGRATSVIPTSASALVDLRPAPTANETELMEMVNSWAQYAGNGTKVEYLRRDTQSLATPIDSSNIYWTAMNETVHDLGIKLTTLVKSAATDSLYLRDYGVPTIGFSAKYRTEPRAHMKNEYLNMNVFLRGIEIYAAIIKKIANLPANNMNNA